jgi:hydroxyacylglutathione hydrolase
LYRYTTAIDPADPYTVKDVAKRLNLKLTAILTTHKHHDHAGGNYELQRSCGGTLAVYGHAKVGQYKLS